MPIESSNPYTQMQLHHYETTADMMNVENHRVHNGNPDYWDILVNDTESSFRDKVGRLRDEKLSLIPALAQNLTLHSHELHFALRIERAV